RLRGGIRCWAWITLLLLSLAGSIATASRAATASSGPLVDVAAFRGQGHLAFLWNGRPYLLDGQKATLRALPQRGAISGLSWSPDGRWLAYLDVTSSTGSGSLWVVRADGRGARPLTELSAPVLSYAWSSRGHTLQV